MNTSHTSLLTQKNAVILGAAGAVGTALAKEFAAQGANVYLSGRNSAGVEQVAQDIHQSGGTAYAARVDVLDEQAVQAYLDRVAKEAGSIDIVINVTGPQAKDYGNATETLKLPLEQFMLPMTTLAQSQFITSRAAAQHMVKQHSGVILFLTAIPVKGFPNASAIAAAFGAMESLLRCLAVELGPAGVRVVGIRSGAMPDTRTIQQSIENTIRALSLSKEQVVSMFEQRSLLKLLPTVDDTARLAAFLASDVARTITGAIVNSSAGSVID
ncbi:MAG TPA: SDR family oxidoreductase [Ktedonobacteraceae bacterium]|nr:SDR family oxidoreductase [Ktedonobacteraceae bacterium]